MQIVFDNIIFFLQKTGGISVYWSELIKRIIRKQTVIFISSNQKTNNIQNEQLDLQHFRIINDLNLPINLLRFLPFLGVFNSKTIFHSSYQRIAMSKNAINIVTIHDLGYELKIMRKGIRRYIHLFFKQIAIKKAHGIICVSENTKSDLLKFYPNIGSEKVTVIYNGVGNAYKKHNSLSLPYKMVHNKYILFVGNRAEYKNFNFAVSVIKSIPGYDLVIAGGKPLSSKEINYLDCHIKNRYMAKNGISDEEMAILYNNAHCLLYPSKYEGFGIPIIEAMRCYCPVIALNISSIPEVAGNHALLLSGENIPECIAIIEKLEDGTFRQIIVEEGYNHSLKFSWDNMANQTFLFYEKVYQQHPI